MSLPFLDEQDEARVIAAVVVVVCHAMAEGNDIGALCEPSCAHTRHLVVDVLLKVSVCECARERQWESSRGRAREGVNVYEREDARDGVSDGVSDGVREKA